MNRINTKEGFSKLFPYELYMETIYRAYKYRLYPTKAQEMLINKHIGACRWTYNYALEKKTKAYTQDKTKLSRFQIQADLPELKKSEETEWLKEVNSQSLQAALEHMDNAFVHFFREKKGFPKFKSKHYSKQSFSIPQNTKVDWDNKRISVPKIKNIKFVLDRKPEGVIKSSTISRTPTGKYFISILVDSGLPFPEKHLIKPETTIGIDLGIKDFLITSNGDKIENPKYLKKHLYRLKKLQRRASKKQKRSNNRKKANLKVSKLHEHIHNVRTNFLHKLSTKLIRENQTICLEDLNVEGMLRNHKLAQSISDCSWSRFVEFLEYKAAWYGSNIVRIGRLEPSSKMCSVCGWIKNELTLGIREWECEKCHTIHDRDKNASTNIRNIGLKEQLLIIGTECSELKLLENTLSKRDSVKEETQRYLAVV
jgi:putative transposase